ncbi:MAG: hypothetical protein IJI03_20925 [Rudaea sp.]|uniref:hypothetical protein n=1 Tax=Rudaea sp. 3F27F6 TaxID=2502208 RepID=UPI0010F61807|nr:hypothetical protein [Rudaea sp. 3F27F6]MBR0347721.1 hypothetical protein [Rudaea sp.]
MKSNAKSRKRCVLTVACAISSMSLFALTPAGATEAYHGVAVSPTSEALHAWHENLKAFPPLEEGCFHATYPEMTWEAEPCVPVPAIRPSQLPRQGAAGSAVQSDESTAGTSTGVGSVAGTTGNGTDYMAQTSGLTQSATGSFPTVTGVTSASTGDYSLQINTNLSPGTSTFCSSLGYPSCYTWEQFIYGSNYDASGVSGLDTGVVGAQAYIQNWIYIPATTQCSGFNFFGFCFGTQTYVYNCPNGWANAASVGAYTFGGNQYIGCAKNSAGVAASNVAYADLGKVVLSGSASISGNDAVTFTYGTTAKAVTQNGNTADIGATWNQTEFNIFGLDAGSPQATFNSGSSLTVQVKVSDGTLNTPTCLSKGETGEYNNLTLGPCTAAAPTATTAGYIQFTESN